jgi:hypothetical protein
MQPCSLGTEFSALMEVFDKMRVVVLQLVPELHHCAYNLPREGC